MIIIIITLKKIICYYIIFKIIILKYASARHQRTLQDHGYGLVYHAMCLFTSPAFAGYSFQPTHRGRRDEAE